MTESERLLKNIFLVLSAALVIVLLYISKVMAGFLVPIFVAFFTAFLLQPFIHNLNKAKVPNWLSIILVVAIFLLILTTLMIILVASINNFAEDLPAYTIEFRQKIVDFFNNIYTNELIQKYIDLDRAMEMIFEMTTNINFGSYMMTTMSKTADMFKNVGLYIIALIFILPGVENVMTRVIKAFPNNDFRIRKVFYNVTVQIQNYIVVKSLVSLMIGLLSFIICLVFGIKYALLWGFVTFLLNYIPYLGSFIAVLPPVILSLIQFQSPIRSLILLIALTAAQMIIGNIVEPKFHSRGVNLAPIVIFTSLLIWGYLWGVAGVFLAVPLMSAFNLICENIESLRPISVLISSGSKPLKTIKEED